MSRGELILPGGTIGVLGGGQLGRMLAQAAGRLGYHVHVFEPVGPCPAGEMARKEVNAPYEDVASLAAFARECDVVTYEFENVPAAPLREIEELTQLHPHWKVLETCQNRSREKNWLRARGFPLARFAEVPAGGDVAAGVREVGLPCVVKTADFGYDGKGQIKVREESEVPATARAFADRACVIEQWIDFAREISAVVARGATGEVRVYPVTENIHTDHILDFSIVPARVQPPVTAAAEDLARHIAEAIGLVGVMGVEMFVTRAENVLVNELAPRTHNSGHWTLDACATSQFEQQVRAICGLPLGDVTLTSPAVMVNILGDAWGLRAGSNRAAAEPDWPGLLAQSTTKLHLYGKREPRAGRKMGHFTITADSAERAFELAQAAKARLPR
ncbi:MAG TPA: 5-(carboxyamino)imidazole ribonucleotide synthase [Lacunisphaera sp.]|nr:5-(carboxyamino)imidazole ribonucleotide synthase [Lacunisphaera sp.]